MYPINVMAVACSERYFVVVVVVDVVVVENTLKNKQRKNKLAQKGGNCLTYKWKTHQYLIDHICWCI